MRLYKQIHKGILGNVQGYARDILTYNPVKKATVKNRYSSNINVHINNKVGLFMDIKNTVDKYGIIEKNINGKTKYIRIY